MGRDVSIMEDEFELSLELSIGGSYAKSDTQIKKAEEKTGEVSTFGERDDKIDNEKVDNLSLSRSDFVTDLGAENGFGLADLQKRREIQALRRQEARIKREEKLKKPRGLNNGGVFMEDKLSLEAQQFRGRVHERESKEREWVSEDSGRKREKNGIKKEAVKDLNISLFTENTNLGDDCAGRVELLPIGMNGIGYTCVVQTNDDNVARAAAENGGRNSFVDCDIGNCAVAPPAAASDGDLEQSSPAVSDYQSMSQKGGNNSDTGSHSSRLAAPCASRRDKFEHLKVNDTSLSSSTSRPQLHSNMSKMTEKPIVETHSSLTNHTCSTVEGPKSPLSKDTSGSEPVNKPPKQPSNRHDGSPIQRMPCVSTTGNGPNGKTINGFLYKYTATEVSIMCVCHGSSFSPAGFVEHAGGVDVTNPLRHITIVATKLAS